MGLMPPILQIPSYIHGSPSSCSHWAFTQMHLKDLERSWKLMIVCSTLFCSTKALLVWTLASLSLRTPCFGEAWGPPYEPWEMPRKEMVRSKTLQKWKQQNHAKSLMTLHFGRAHGYTKPNNVRIRSELLGFWLKPFGEAHSLQSFQGKVQCGRIP